jgi:hypothetical protein
MLKTAKKIILAKQLIEFIDYGIGIFIPATIISDKFISANV